MYDVASQNFSRIYSTSKQRDLHLWSSFKDLRVSVFQSISIKLRNISIEGGRQFLFWSHVDRHQTLPESQSSSVLGSVGSEAGNVISLEIDSIETASHVYQRCYNARLYYLFLRLTNEVQWTYRIILIYEFGVQFTPIDTKTSQIWLLLCTIHMVCVLL